jgi:hypothetical protein
MVVAAKKGTPYVEAVHLTPALTQCATGVGSYILCLQSLAGDSTNLIFTLRAA